jgi:hypothetical protein
MRIPKPWALCGLFLTALTLTTFGCAKANLIKVEGVVTLDGKILPGATVSFMPVGAGRPASGRTDRDGSFRLTTFQTDDGALPGDYIVVVHIEEANEKLAGREPKTFTNEEKQAARMGTMTPMGKQKAAAEKKNKKPLVEVPAIYGDVKQTPLKQVVPPPGKVELALRSGAS